MVELKSRSPSLKCLVAIGGYNPALESAWYTMASDSASRLNFAKNVQRFLIANRLDGVGKKISGDLGLDISENIKQCKIF
jgi:GH18 family chitinase